MSLFKKQPTIKQIDSVIAGDLIFTFGLGKDGKVYTWDSVLCSWRLHKYVAPKEAANAEA